MNGKTKLKFVLLTLFTALFASALLFAGKKAGKTDKDLIVVESKDFTISLHEFESIASTQSPSLQHSLMTEPASKLAFLDKLINMNLLAAEAKKRGFKNNPEIIAVKKNRLAALMQRNIENNIKITDPSDSEISKYYNDNIGMFNKPEKIRARQILLTDKIKATALLKKLKESKISQYDFRKLAIEKNEDNESAEKGGNLSFFTKDGTRRTGHPPVDPKLAQAAFDIPENGDLYPSVIQTSTGYHILMRTGHRAPINTTIENAKERIARLIKRDQRQKQIDDALAALEKKYKVTLFEENLKHVVIDLSQQPVNFRHPNRKNIRRLTRTN